MGMDFFPYTCALVHLCTFLTPNRMGLLIFFKYLLWTFYLHLFTLPNTKHSALVFRSPEEIFVQWNWMKTNSRNFQLEIGMKTCLPHSSLWSHHHQQNGNHKPQRRTWDKKRAMPGHKNLWGRAVKYSNMWTKHGAQQEWAHIWTNLEEHMSFYKVGGHAEGQTITHFLVSVGLAG